MLESLSSAFAGVSLVQLVLIAGMALFASIVGGVSGYGTGALMPLVLAPIFGPEPVVPMLSISALINNASRAGVFRHLVDVRRALIVLPMALPFCMLGAWGYTQLSGRGAALVIGTMMAASVPLRRLLRRRGFGLTDRSLALASAGWGAVAGGTTGAGVMLLSMLMAAGLQGAAVIATDAVISIGRSEEHTSELQSRPHLVCRLLLEKKKTDKLKRTGFAIREMKLLSLLAMLPW